MTIKMGSSQLRLLERLCNATAVSGSEEEVRAIVLEELRSAADEIKIDQMGNVLVKKTGHASRRLRVMLDAHMDEVGFIITSDEGEGIFRFELVGSMDIRQLPGKFIQIGSEHVPGVIGVRPVHMINKKERRERIPLDTLRIDVGFSEKKVKPGDYGTFATRFQRSGQTLIGKAFDDRLGVATLIELVKDAPANIDLLAAFTVQEEVGLRGAGIAAYSLEPDLAISVDSTPANDLPSWDGEENTIYNTRLGCGPAIYVSDGATLSDPRLVRLLLKTAKEKKIPCQIRQPGGGGTNAGAIHLRRKGIPSVSISVPGRYAHTAAGLVNLDDWTSTLALMHASLQRITPDLLSKERA